VRYFSFDKSTILKVSQSGLDQALSTKNGIRQMLRVEGYDETTTRTTASISLIMMMSKAIATDLEFLLKFVSGSNLNKMDDEAFEDLRQIVIKTWVN
jgi:hypothetical protein